jgi:hypothetical protein
MLSPCKTPAQGRGDDFGFGRRSSANVIPDGAQRQIRDLGSPL